jgi:hypothetical protein
VCTADRVSAEQGRSFPPWGTRALTGAAWKPIALPPAAECKPRETDDVHELEGWFLAALLERASATLARRDLLDAAAARAADATPPVSPLDAAAAQLEQALLLARAPDRRDQRAEVDRLMGDLEYWRAMLRLRDSAAGLVEAAKQLDDAAAHHPRHANDAAAWAGFVRELGDTLRAGPTTGASSSSASGSAAAADHAAVTPASRPPAPQGAALPVEPSQPEALPIDAGVPTGGVLL